MRLIRPDEIPEIPAVPPVVKPDRGWRYRRWSDGMLARVVIYCTATDSVRLWDVAGNRHWEGVEGFWANWIHVDLYDPNRN